MQDTKIAVVTEASRGIGLEVVHQLAKMGMRVIPGTRELAKGEATAQPFLREGLSIFPRQLDRSDQQSITRLYADITAEFGQLDILVNAICPGRVAIEMRGPGGRPVSQGVWAATQPDNGPGGRFFRERKPGDYTEGVMHVSRQNQRSKSAIRSNISKQSFFDPEQDALAQAAHTFGVARHASFCRSRRAVKRLNFSPE